MENNPYWKGENATTSSIHCWIRDNFKKPLFCEICNRPDDKTKLFEWSNKDHKYSRLREDWRYICRGCHNEWDYNNNGRVRAYSKRKYFWSVNYEKCVLCGRNNVKYRALGMCSNCYQHKSKT